MAASALCVRALAPASERSRERSGRFERSAEGPGIWVHACSAGEMMVARRFIDGWRDATAKGGVLVTAWTTDGHNVAMRHLRPGERVAWFPVDSRAAMRRAYESARPTAVILCEAELWPNHLAEAKARGIPAFVINGRMSQRDYAKYRRIGNLAAEFFAIPDVVFAQGEDDARRFAALGARRVVVTGNMKFDPLKRGDPTLPDKQMQGDFPYVLAASTHPGEEEAILRAFGACAKIRPDLRIVIAPRHVGRSETIARLARRKGLRAHLWSRRNESGDDNCIVIDRVGLLTQFYARAEFAFVGKSLHVRGGQNFLEAVDAGCPVLLGPHTANFDTMLAPFLVRRAVWQLDDPGHLAEAFVTLATREEERIRMAAEARSIMRENSGATTLTVREILSRL